MSHQNSTISVNTIEPESGTTLTIGKSGQDVVVNADSIKNNILKDAGGNAIWTSNGSGVVSGVNSGFGSAQVLISTQTADDSASLSFTTGIDSTYKEYVFICINMNPADNDKYFQFQGSTDGGSNYNTTITSTAFMAYHLENGTGSALTYRASEDQQQGTVFQDISGSVGNDADKSGVMQLQLFNPSSTTYVKNWYVRANATNGDGNPLMAQTYIGGYFNTTLAINAVQFKFASGNINEGTIKMYGIK